MILLQLTVHKKGGLIEMNFAVSCINFSNIFFEKQGWLKELICSVEK